MRLSSLVLAGATCALAGCSAAGSAPPPATALAWHGALIQNPPAKAGFTLTDTAGRPFNLRQDTDGKVTLLYFGYTHCPDACPADMATLTGALRQLPADVRGRISAVFVTTDPARDTGPVLRRWLDRFDPSLIGLVGSAAEINRAEATSGVTLATPQSPGPGGQYAVDHAAYVLVYGGDGRAHEAFPNGVPAAGEAQDLTRIARGEVPG
jgi:protein SCO1/2